MRRAALILLAATLSANLAGCSTGVFPPDDNTVPLSDLERRDTPPADFALAVTVLAPPAGAFAGSARLALAPRNRPARYVIDADWVLHAALGPAASEAVYPGPTRQLDRDEMGVLWRELRDAGLLSPSLPSDMTLLDDSSRAAEPASASVTYIISSTAAGEHRRVVLDGSSNHDPRIAARLVDRLARLAWVTP